MKKRLLIMLSVLFGVMGGVNFVYADSTPSGYWAENYRATSFSNEDSENKVITIKTAAELALLAYELDKAGNDFSTYEGWTINLEENIDLSAHYWTPIGLNSNRQFKGSFNGNGYTVSGINIDQAHCEYAGLFGCVVGGRIENLKITNSTITNPTGQYQAGAITAYAQHATISNCFVASDVTVRGTIAGGIVGYMSNADGAATIEGCVSYATIGAANSNSYYRLGGIVGEVGNTSNTGVVKNCIYGGGNFITEGYNADGAGAIYGKIPSNANLTLTNNYYLSSSLTGMTNTSGAQAYPVNLKVNSNSYNIVENVTVTPEEATDTYTNASTSFFNYNNNNFFSLNDTYYAATGTRVPFTATMKPNDPNNGQQTIPADVRFDNLQATNGGMTVTLTEVSAVNKLYTVTTVDYIHDYLVYADKYTWYGSGTSADDPYQIKSIDHMSMLAERVNSGTTDYEGKFFALYEDLTYNANTANNYTPIGTYDDIHDRHPFKGTFDGQGKTISGIRSEINHDNGLFGYVSAATIKNLKLTDCQFTSTGAENGAGAIVGYAAHTINPTHIYTIENCIVGNDVICNGERAGGIVATSGYGTIAGCVSAATVNAYGNDEAKNYAGGIIGFAEQGSDITLTNNLFTGTVSGNITAAIIAYTLNQEDITNTRTYFTDDSFIGQSGYNQIFAIAYNDINGTYMNVKGESIINYEYDGIQAYENGLVYGNKLYLGDKAWSEWDGAGLLNNPYLIPDIHTMNLLALKVNKGENLDNIYFKLTNNLDYTLETYTPVGTADHPFKGVFDGNGNTIRKVNFNHATSDYQGLFGVVSSGTVKNLTLSAATITGKNYVGGIAGQVRTTLPYSASIENCHVEHSTIGGTAYVGGIVGLEGHYVTGTAWTSENCSIEGCTSSATVTAEDFAGGIVGMINYRGTVVNNLYFGDNDDITVTTSSQEKHAGLLIGRINATETTRSHNYYINGTSTNANDTKAYAYRESDSQSYIAGLTPDKTYEPNGIKVFDTLNGLFYVDALFSSDNNVAFQIVHLTDGTPYDSDAYGNKTANEVTYTRSTPTSRMNKYMPWFVPFELTVTEEIAEYFTFYELASMTHSYSAGDATDASSETIYIQVRALEQGDKVTSNKPYVFKNTKAVDGESYTFTVNNATLSAKNTGKVMDPSTNYYYFDFYGVYDSASPTTENPFFYMGADGKFHFGDGTVNLTLGSYRWYFTATSKNSGNNSNYAKMRNISVGVVAEDEATGIANLSAESAGVEGYYTLNGVKVQNPGKGLHIVKFANGETKKIFIK